MLKITIPAWEGFNETTNEFITIQEQTIALEHSLVSISKWEQKWHIPFLSVGDKTDEQVIDYIRCMTLTQNVPPEIYTNIPPDILVQINEYIGDPRTALKFNDSKRGGAKASITNETIYYWMISLQIPVEFQKWHLNHLLALIRLCQDKNAPAKKMSNREIISRDKALNEARRKKFNSKG